MSFGIWELAIVLIIVALVFGTKRLRSMGSDLGSALKGFRSALKDEDTETISQQADDPVQSDIIEGEVEQQNESVSGKS